MQNFILLIAERGGVEERKRKGSDFTRCDQVSPQNRESEESNPRHRNPRPRRERLYPTSVANLHLNGASLLSNTDRALTPLEKLLTHSSLSLSRARGDADTEFRSRFSVRTATAGVSTLRRRGRGYGGG